MGLRRVDRFTKQSLEPRTWIGNGPEPFQRVTIALLPSSKRPF